MTATLGAVSLNAQEIAVPVELQVTLLNKIWSFDRAHDARVKDGLVIGVVYQSRYRASSLIKDEFETHARSLVDVPEGVSFEVIGIELEDVAELPAVLAAERVDVLYVAPLRAVDVDAIGLVTRQLGVLSCTGVPSYVAAGISVVLDILDERPLIHINQRAALAEGARLRSQLLRIVELVGARP